jgi:prolipoprotein diacylglyceryltransferase
MMSALNLLIFVLLAALLCARTHRRLAPGMVAVLYLLLNSSGLFFLEFLRADETLYFGTLRWSQVAEAGQFIVALLALLYLRAGSRKATLGETAPDSS